MRKPTIRTTFVDFGNVCAAFDFHRFIENMSRAAKVPEADIERVLLKKSLRGHGVTGYSPLFAALECGEIRPRTFFHELTAALACTKQIDYFTFEHLWTNIFYGENEALDSLLTRLTSKKCLLSNTNVIVYGRCIARCKIVQNHFPLPKQRILSYEVGVIKPDQRIYKIALAQAKAEPEESLFIDDMLENVAAWRALGGHGIVYDVQKDFIGKLSDKLSAFGVLK